MSELQSVPEQDASLLRVVAYALRHAPQQFFLEMDRHGWVKLDLFLLALRFHRRDWANLTIVDVRRVAEQSHGPRFEIIGNRIRALYGHSISELVGEAPSVPPAYLFHGTARELVSQILEQGLLPMGRARVHLTLDCRYAASVAEAKSERPIVLVVRACEAHEAGVRFWKANDHVWLAEAIPARFIGASGLTAPLSSVRETTDSG